MGIDMRRALEVEQDLSGINSKSLLSIGYFGVKFWTLIEYLLDPAPVWVTRCNLIDVLSS